MLSSRNAMTPPKRIITNSITIGTRCLSEKATIPFMTCVRFPTDLLRPRRHAIDEETALGDHAIAGRKTFDHLDHIAVGEPDLDPPQLDRFFVVFVAHHPDASGFALVDDGIARHRDRLVAFTGEDLHAGKHFRLEQTGGVFRPRPPQQPPGGWVPRRSPPGTVAPEPPL